MTMMPHLQLHTDIGNPLFVGLEEPLVLDSMYKTKSESGTHQNWFYVLESRLISIRFVLGVL